MNYLRTGLTLNLNYDLVQISYCYQAQYATKNQFIT
jgi:hypothetical protein